MKAKVKKVKNVIIIALCLTMILGISANAANPVSYYKIHLRPYWEIVATNSYIGGEIIDWESPIYAGQTVDASVQLLEGKNEIPYTGIEWKWMYGNTVLSNASSYVIPDNMSGKTLTVKAQLLGNVWDKNKPLTVNVPVR